MENDNPLVSIIIPTYNREHFLKDAIESVLLQTYKNWELLIVDDGSTDNTAELVKKFSDERVRYIYQQKSGAPVARNKGVRESKGEYIAFLDSDDIWLPQKLQRQLEIFKTSRINPGVVYTGIQRIDGKGNPKKRGKNGLYRGNLFNLLLRKNITTTSAMLVKRECFDKCGMFDESLPSRQELDMLMRISLCFPIDCVGEILTLERIHDGRISSDIDKKIKGREMLFKKIEPHLRKRRILLAKYLYGTGELYLKKKDFQKGREYIKSSMKVFPLLRSILTLIKLNKKRT